jgi:hypothetical protein
MNKPAVNVRRLSEAVHFLECLKAQLDGITDSVER